MVGANIYLSWTPTQMIRTYLNGGVNYTDIQSTVNSELRNSGFSGRAFGGLNFTFPKDFRVGANGGFFLNRIQLQTEQSAFYFYSFSHVKKAFLIRNLTWHSIFRARFQSTGRSLLPPRVQGLPRKTSS